MRRYNQLFLYLLLMMCISSTYACGSFGNGGDGCSDIINGVEVWDDGSLEIDVSNHVTWYPGHVCTGTFLLKFDGSNPSVNAKASVALTAYTTQKPIFFRCSTKISTIQCSCQFIVIGNHYRD